MTIDNAFPILLGFEGTEFTNYKNDLGGETKYGISKAAYPNVDIANLTEEQAKAIYATDYWLKGNCQKLKPELQYAHFDTCVNMGVNEAVKILQRAARITDDGIFGAQTLVQSDKVSIEGYLLQREWVDDLIVEERREQIANLGGWSNRNKSILQLFRDGKLQ